MINEIAQVDERLIRKNLINLKQIVFEVTEKCNLNCVYCGLSDLYQEYEIRENRDLPFEKAKLLIDYLINLWQDNQTVDAFFRLSVGFYGGEPLMNVTLIKEIIDYLELSEITGKRIQYSMTTNALLLDKHMDFLVEKNFDLLISLDGDEKAHSYRMDHAGNNSFNRVMSNVLLIQTQYPEYFRKSVHFISVLHNRNDVEPIYHFFKTRFEKDSKIIPLNNSGVRKDKIHEFREMYQWKSQSLLKSPNCEAIEAEFFFDTPKGYRLAMYLFYLSGNIFFNYNQLLLNQHRFFTGTCTPFAKRLFVTATGNILPCERIDHDFVMGCIHDDFVELNFQHVANMFNSYLSKCAQQCVCCATNKLCLQCVFFIDDIRNETSYCPDFCSEKEFDKDNDRTLDFLRQHPHFYKKVLTEVGFRM